MGTDTSPTATDKADAQPQEQVRNDMAQLVQSINELVHAQKSELHRRSAEGAHQIEEQLKAHPLKTVGFAFLGGYLAGTLLARKG